MALRDILVKFGIDVDGGQKLQQTDVAIRRALLSAERFGNTLKRLGKFLLVGEIARGVKNFVEDQITQADALKHNAERLGLTTDELQKYQYAAEQIQVPVQQTAVALRYFNRSIGEANLGTKAATKTFATLGINIKGADGQVRPTSDLLGEFADKLKDMPDQATRSAYAMRLLGRNGAAMLPALQKGSKELKTIFKDVDELGGGFNEQFIENAHQVDVALKRLKFAWRSIFVAIATEIIPIFRTWVDHSIHTAKRIIELAKHTYGFRTALMALGAGAVIYPLIRLFKLFNPFKTSIKDVMMALLSNAPLVLFVGLLVAAYLAFDDLYTFLQGGKSVLGDFLDSIGGKGTSTKFLQDVKDAFNKIMEALTPVKGELLETAKGMAKAFLESIPFIIKWGGVFASAVLDALDWGITKLRHFGIIASAIIKGLKPGGDFLAEYKAAGAEADSVEAGYKERHALYQNMARTFDTIGTIGKSSPKPGDEDFVGPAAGGRAGGPQKIEVKVTQHINGAKDPAAVGREATRGIGGAVKTAAAQYRDAYAGIGAGLPIPADD